MPATFIGRQRELALLERAYASAEREFIPIYGRRRIGKSELILHFIRDKRAVYHLGKKAPAPLQVQEFLAEAARALGEPLLARAACTGWADALRMVLERAPERAISIAVKGMMPRGPLGRAMLTKLRVYAGPEHAHAAQQPKPLDF